jgi:hypothetical protein
MASLSISDNVCHQCLKFRDFDTLFAQKPLHLHKSWTDLCQAAKLGCPLCQAFVNWEPSTMEGFDPLPDNIDEDWDPDDAQITWQTHKASEIFRLGQKDASKHSYTDVLNLLLELYVHFGTLLLLSSSILPSFIIQSTIQAAS